jgi:AcrR family transcriptional regulator
MAGFVKGGELPRHPDPNLEQRILEAASRLWSRGGERALTMRAVAKMAGTTTPTVYERYRHRDDILGALRKETRRQLLEALRPARTLRQSAERYLQFALEHSYAYEVLFDGVAKPPSLYEPWPSFRLLRERLARELGGGSRQYTRLMLALWSVMHGTAMLVIRGRFEGALRIQSMHACLDAVDAIVYATKSKHASHSGPKWPSTLILGEGQSSRVNGIRGGKRKSR